MKLSEDGFELEREQVDRLLGTGTEAGVLPSRAHQDLARDRWETADSIWTRSSSRPVRGPSPSFVELMSLHVLAPTREEAEPHLAEGAACTAATCGMIVRSRCTTSTGSRGGAGLRPSPHR
jgi:hypothetical protein